MIRRVYTKVNSEAGFKELEENAKDAVWYNDSYCEEPVITDIGEFITEIFLDTDPSGPVVYPQLVCAEVGY